MFSLPIKDLTFKDLERNFFELGCEIARNMMQQFLEQADEDLARNRNKAQLRHKGKKTTTIKTLTYLTKPLALKELAPYPLTLQKRS